jgi:acetylornithine deacetylase/succinyl-diaminopimelate desuccinylase-like protein
LKNGNWFAQTSKKLTFSRLGMTAIDTYLTTHATRFEDELCELLRIPSVSADSRHNADTARASQWIAHQFQSLDFQTTVHPTAGHPIVVAHSPKQTGVPTVMVYGHYDVQPPDPLQEWITPPFEPTRRNGNIYARGATDDKGQMFTHIKSAEAWIKTAGQLPVNLIYLIEGEEEVGSANLEQFLAQHAAELACDVIVVSDTSQFAPGQPAITYGLRGLAYYELRLQGPKQDLHSGVFGGAVTNPANALCKILAALRDDQGRVTFPGFYDAVAPLTERERREFANLPFKDEKFFAQLQVAPRTINGQPVYAVGEEGYSTLERRWARPTFDIHGLTSGYQGEGAKTVLPARASAKFSFRLVPHQEPTQITAALKRAIEPLIPPGITSELIDHHGGASYIVPLESPFIAAAERAIEHGFGVRPVFMREGGSIPITSTFKRILQVDTLLLGWGLDDDNTHSPNEKFCLADFHRGIKSSAALWGELAKLK